MARSYTGGTASQKEFVKLFDSLTAGRFTRWEIWQDMIWMFATSISNSVDRRFYDSREKKYMDIARKYNPEEMQVFPKLLAVLANNMDQAIEKGDWNDFLGEIFMGLDLGSELRGQFFTPYHACHMMSKIMMDDKTAHETLNKQGYISVMDCACGAGAMLIAAAQSLKETGINYQQNAIFVAQDIDSTTALMCYVQLSLLCCPGYVKIGNSLTEPITGHVLWGEGTESYWYTPFFFAQPWETRRAIETCKAIFHSLDDICGKEHDNRTLIASAEENEKEESVSADQHDKPERESEAMQTVMEALDIPDEPVTQNLPARKGTRKPSRKRTQILEGQITFQI